MEKRLIMAAAVFFMMSFTAAGASQPTKDYKSLEDNCIYSEAYQYWECVISDYTGQWLPPLFLGYVAYDGGWVADLEHFDLSLLDAEFSKTPLSIKANCGGGCNVMFGSYWADAYSEYLVLFPAG